MRTAGALVGVPAAAHFARPHRPAVRHRFPSPNARARVRLRSRAPTAHSTRATLTRTQAQPNRVYLPYGWMRVLLVAMCDVAHTQAASGSSASPADRPAIFANYLSTATDEACAVRSIRLARKVPRPPLACPYGPRRPCSTTTALYRGCHANECAACTHRRGYLGRCCLYTAGLARLRVLRVYAACRPFATHGGLAPSGLQLAAAPSLAAVVTSELLPGHAAQSGP